MEWLLVLALAFMRSESYGTPLDMEIDYIQQCEPLFDAGDFDGHDQCTSELIDAYYGVEELDA